MKGTSRFRHGYTENANAPLTAFFTGGDRSLECARGPSPTHSADGAECMAGEFGTLLHNNNEGRFRLETEVWITGDVHSKAAASPVILMPPIIPVPHAPYGERSKFHVPAYDPLGNPLHFRFGTPIEMGGIVRSKSDAFPWSDGLNMAANYSSSLYNTTTGELLFDYIPYNETGFVPKSIGTQSGTFYCNEHTKSFVLGGGADYGSCQEDRVPQLPGGVTQYSFTSSVPGLVEWNTWVDSNGQPCTAQTSAGCAGRLPNGLYNFVVIASQVCLDGPPSLPPSAFPHTCDQSAGRDSKQPLP